LPLRNTLLAYYTWPLINWVLLHSPSFFQFNLM
jgi:hypothetical protein